MAQERRSAPADGGEPQVKVTDRRRFNADGEPVQQEEQAAEETPVPAEASPPPAAEDPRIAEQAARIDELTRAYAALVEDNKAFRQRLEREKARVLDSERAEVAQTLLAAADDLERALGAVAGTGGEAAGGLAEGVRITLGTLHQRIARLGAERIPVTGLPFDPHVAEAVDAVAVSDEAQDGVVLQEITPGYRIGGRVLRPARVRVGRVARA